MRKPKAKVKMTVATTGEKTKSINVGKQSLKITKSPTTGKTVHKVTNLVTGNTKTINPKKEAVVKTAKGLAVVTKKTIPLKSKQGVKHVAISQKGDILKPKNQKTMSKTVIKAKATPKSKKKGVLKKAFTGSKLKGVGKGVKILAKGTVKGVKKGSKFIAKSVGNVALAPLLPFKKAMKLRLEKDGVSTKRMTMIDLVQQFHNRYVAKDKLEEVSNLETFDSFKVYEVNHLQEDSIEPVILASMVTGIVKVFKEMKKKKEQAKKEGKDPKKVLTATELAMANTTEKVSEVAKQQVEDKEPVTVGDEKAKNKKMLMIGGGVVLLIILFLMFRK